MDRVIASVLVREKTVFDDAADLLRQDTVRDEEYPTLAMMAGELKEMVAYHNPVNGLMALPQ
eukprot:1516371-Rhodomonas_salina.1